MGKIIITVGNGNIGRTSPNKDGVTAIVFGTADPASGLANGVVSPKLTKLSDAEDLGITAQFDTDNNQLIHHHISEFFRIKESFGQTGELYIMLVPNASVDMEDMVTSTSPYLKKISDDTNGEVRLAGVVLNPVTGYTPTLAGGLDNGVVDAVTAAQLLADTQKALMRPLDVFIEGRSYNGTAATLTDVRSLENPDVYVVIAADNDISSISAEMAGYAAVGTTLGVVSAAKVSENIGWTGKFNVQDKNLGNYLNVGLSNGNLASASESDYEVLTSKGYIFLREYPGQSGVYFDDFPTCDLITSDYAYGTESRVIKKAIRLVYDAIFPRINGPLLVDADTGTLSPSVAKAIESEAVSGMNVMLQNEEVSGVSANVDPTQDVQTTGKIVIKLSVVSIATGRTLEIELGFAKSI